MSRRNFRQVCGTSICGVCTCGARTHACRVHTRVNAEARVSTTPGVVFNDPDQIRLDGIPLDVPRNPAPFLLTSHPVIVRLALPKRLAGAIQRSVGIPCGRPLQRFQELSRTDDRQEQRVDVVRHDRERAELVMTQLDASVKRIDHDFSDRILRQKHWPAAPGIEISINPSEGFARRGFDGRWESPCRYAAVQRPSHKKPAAFRIAVRQSSAGIHRPVSADYASKFSRSHECERGTHECVRHNTHGNISQWSIGLMETGCDD